MDSKSLILWVYMFLTKASDEHVPWTCHEPRFQIDRCVAWRACTPDDVARLMAEVFARHPRAVRVTKEAKAFNGFQTSPVRSKRRMTWKNRPLPRLAPFGTTWRSQLSLDRLGARLSTRGRNSSWIWIQQMAFNSRSDSVMTPMCGACAQYSRVPFCSCQVVSVTLEIVLESTPRRKQGQLRRKPFCKRSGRESSTGN